MTHIEIGIAVKGYADLNLRVDLPGSRPDRLYENIVPNGFLFDNWLIS